MKIISKNIYLLILLVICLLGITLTPSYAKFTSGFTTDEDIVGVNFSFYLNISNIEEYEEITVDAKSYQIFNVEITNNTGSTAYYGIWYKMVKPLDVTNDIIIARLDDSTTTTSGSIDNNSSKIITIIIINNTTDNIKINIGVNNSTTSTSDIEYLGGKYLITNKEKIPFSGINAPNLDNDNLIPVYYDVNTEVWRKANKYNLDNSWYDYGNKKWANAILIKDSTTRVTYQNAAVNTEIPITDISAFYVWIPRFKYRVWNITRQGGTENTYAYLAYSNGIDIVFEEGVASTGNVTCSYNANTAEGANNLSDICKYNGTSITTISGNANYKNAWYTHPAFNFDGTPKTGFWIGKFETSGSAAEPKVVPDNQSLRQQTVSQQFTTSKVFQNYGLSSSLDAHILTNLEWGAVVYLTQSIYGLCDGTSCRDVYINNSSSCYTGRSGGAISGSADLSLTNFYGSSITTSTERYNTNGYYNYKGYKIDSSGAVSTSEKNESKVGSTTGNVTGVYDMSGGCYENVMGNMVNSSGAFYPSSSGISTLDTKYYNSYSYSNSNIDNQIAFNRARLGDATAEVIGNSSGIVSWKPGSSITGAYSSFVSSSNSWFYRGGRYSSTNSGEFSFGIVNGNSGTEFTSRSSLS